MQNSAKKQPRNLSTSYTMNNSSSFITLPNGTVKRKRHKATYKDIYLEQFNFVPTEMPPDKKLLIQQNKSVMLTSSKKLNETDASFRSRKKAQQTSTNNNNNNSNSLPNKNGNNKNNEIKSMKGKSIKTNKQGTVGKKKKEEEMILSSLGTDRSFEQKMKMSNDNNDNENNIDNDKASFILSTIENKDKLLTGSLMDKHEHDLDDNEMMHEITNRLNNAIKQQEEKECNELDENEEECENDKNGKKGKRRKVHFENDNNNNDTDNLNDGDVNGNGSNNTKDIKKSNLKCGKENDEENNKGGESNGNNNNKDNDNLMKDDPTLKDVNANAKDQLNENETINDKQKRKKRRKKHGNNCSNEDEEYEEGEGEEYENREEDEEYDDNITNEQMKSNLRKRNKNRDKMSTNEENPENEDKTNEKHKNDPSHTHQNENKENNLNVNKTNEQQNQTDLPSYNTKTISTQTEHNILSTLNSLQITTINVELNDPSSKPQTSNTLTDQQQLNTEETPKIYNSNTINISSRISKPFSSKKPLWYGMTTQKTEEEIDIIDSFINKHRQKSKNKSEILLDLKQQTEIELRVLKEKSTLIAKEKKENIKRKKEKKQIRTKEILNSNKKKSFDINTNPKNSLITKSETNNDKYQSRCNTITYNDTITNYDTIYQNKQPYVSIFTNFNKANLNTRNQYIKGTLVKNFHQLSERGNYKYKGMETESDVSNVEIYERLRNNSISLENDVISFNKRKDSNTFLNKVKEDVKGIEMKKGMKEKYNSKCFNNKKFKHTERTQSEGFPKGIFKGGVVMPANSLKELIESRDLYFFNNKINQF